MWIEVTLFKWHFHASFVGFLPCLVNESTIWKKPRYSKAIFHLFHSESLLPIFVISVFCFSFPIPEKCIWFISKMDFFFLCEPLFGKRAFFCKFWHPNMKHEIWEKCFFMYQTLQGVFFIFLYLERHIFFYFSGNIS